MKARPPKKPVSPSRSSKKPLRKKPVTAKREDHLFESLRQELGL
ncbi:hypothetical protein [Haloferula sp. BvORR071]|nr:hypothetical protein [Haloferula sp. BvORR071]